MTGLTQTLVVAKSILPSFKTPSNGLRDFSESLRFPDPFWIFSYAIVCATMGLITLAKFKSVAKSIVVT